MATTYQRTKCKVELLVCVYIVCVCVGGGFKFEEVDILHSDPPPSPVYFDLSVADEL